MQRNDCKLLFHKQIHHISNPSKARPYTTHPTPRKAPSTPCTHPTPRKAPPNTTRPTSRRAPPYTTYSLRSYPHFEITGNSVLDLISK